ncbi:MAG: hypothetical protein JXB50_02200 [Spirochaetes bacterium]|nr:hypothetical protein [Spirochaetota bacterium]
MADNKTNKNQYAVLCNFSHNMKDFAEGMTASEDDGLSKTDIEKLVKKGLLKALEKSKKKAEEMTEPE